MHSVHLIDLAAVVSEHGPAILYGRETLSPEALTHYWTATHSRFNLWHQAMARYSRAEQLNQESALNDWWEQHTPVMEEILVSEILTRVVAALGIGLDSQVSEEKISPVTHAILLNHLEASNRVHQVMLKANGRNMVKAEQLNRVRRGIESWTDVLIGRMALRNREPLQYAIERERALEYAEEAVLQGYGVIRKTSNALMNMSMHDMISTRLSAEPALPAANREVARSVIATYKALGGGWQIRFGNRGGGGVSLEQVPVPPAEQAASQEADNSAQQDSKQPTAGSEAGAADSPQAEAPKSEPVGFQRRAARPRARAGRAGVG